MLKLKSLFLTALLSTGVILSASSAFAACDGSENCACVQYICLGCK